MLFSTVTLKRNIYIGISGGANSLDSVARLFRSLVTIEINERRMNLKSPESMESVLGIDPRRRMIHIPQGTKLNLEVDGDDEHIASETLFMCLDGTDELAPIWNKHFARLSGCGEVMEASVTVRNELGVHARPSARLSKLARAFDAEILLAAGGQTIWARNVLQVLSLGLGVGAKMKIITFGQSAGAAIVATAELVEARFGEN